MRPRIILQDSREKRPARFPGRVVRVKNLKAGDYTLVGRSRHVGVERKGPLDWAACNYSKARRAELSDQLARFEKHYKHPLLVVAAPPSYLWRTFPGLTVDFLRDEFLRWTERMPAVWCAEDEQGQWIERWLELYG